MVAKDILKANDLNVLGNNRKTQDNRAAFKTGNVIIENTVAASFLMVNICKNRDHILFTIFSLEAVNNSLL